MNMTPSLELLRLQAENERLNRLCPPEVVLGRLGSDEFVLLMPWPQHRPSTRELAQACIDCLNEPFELDNGEAEVGMSMGVEGVRESDDFVCVMARADAAMYQVKRAGKRGMAFHAAPVAGHIGVDERRRGRRAS